MAYVELHAHSAYSFLDGASLPEEIAAAAAAYEYPAFALTDHDGVYGSLEFAHAANDLGLRPITGAEVTLDDGSHITLLVESRGGYRNLCRLLTGAHCDAPPSLDDLAPHAEGLICLSGCARDGLAVRRPHSTARLRDIFGKREPVDRASAAVLARRSRAQPRPRAARREPRRRVRRDRQRPRPRSCARTAAGPVRRRAAALDARPDRARAARQQLLGAGLAGRDGAALRRPSRRRRRDRADRRALPLRPDARHRLQLPRLGGSRLSSASWPSSAARDSSGATAAPPNTPRRSRGSRRSCA